MASRLQSWGTMRHLLFSISTLLLVAAACGGDPDGSQDAGVADGDGGGAGGIDAAPLPPNPDQEAAPDDQRLELSGQVCDWLQGCDEPMPNCLTGLYNYSATLRSEYFVAFAACAAHAGNCLTWFGECDAVGRASLTPRPQEAAFQQSCEAWVDRCDPGFVNSCAAITEHLSVLSTYWIEVVDGCFDMQCGAEVTDCLEFNVPPTLDDILY
jgi:hypothetical protein